MATRWVGVASLDPGGTSGYVQGVVPVRGSFQHKLDKMKLRDAVQIPSAGKGINGASDELIAAIGLFNTWRIFRDRCEGKGVPCITLIEDFNLVQFKSSERHGIATVRVTEAFMALVWKHLTEQEGDGMQWAGMPWFVPVSLASTTATDQRLKDWGLWEKGKEHCRSAWRIWATYVRTHDKQPKEDTPQIRTRTTKGAGSVKRFKSGGKY